jgi:hypothetical protein
MMSRLEKALKGAMVERTPLKQKKRPFIPRIAYVHQQWSFYFYFALVVVVSSSQLGQLNYL